MRAHEEDDGLMAISSLMLDFLASKSLVDSERALRNELQLLLHSKESSRDPPAAWKKIVCDYNVYTSELEKRLNITVPLTTRIEDSPVIDHTPMLAASTSPLEDEDIYANTRLPANTAAGTPRVARVSMYTHSRVSTEQEQMLRSQRGLGKPQEHAVFHDSLERGLYEAADACAHISLPLLYNPNFNGLEAYSETKFRVGDFIARRYHVCADIGSGAFSTVYKCHDRHNERMVSVKVLRNGKERFDSGLGEVRALSLISQHDPLGQRQVMRLLDYFYHKEHLIIVSELLRDSLLSFYTHLQSKGRRLEYFSPPVLACLSSQLLDALVFLHEIGITHCDVKPENVCLTSASPPNFKLIDLGSAVLTFDCHNSYVQTRCYRAPEVMLGMVWDSRVDIWSVGCILAELIHGAPIFYAHSSETVLAAQVAALGPLPAYMTHTSPNLSQMFVSGTAIYEIDPKDHPPGAYLLEPLPHARLDRLLSKSVDDLTGVIPFVIDLMQMDPATRPTAQEALDHPWLESQLTASTPSVVNICSGQESGSSSTAASR